VFYYLLRKLKKDNVLLYAQGLTFNTLLTLIPITGLLISLANLFIPQKTIINQFVVQLAKYLTAEATQKVVKVIIMLITKLEKFPLGKFSVLAYFLMSLGLLFELEEVLNVVFESTTKRSFAQRISFFWLCMTITPLLLFLPFSFYSYFGKLSKGFVFVFMVTFFFLMYIYFPAKKVAKKEALAGALFSGTLWIFSSFLYSIYIKYAVGYSRIYGSLAAIPLFLVWIFINWTIFLIGAELVVLLEKQVWKYPEAPPLSLVKLYILVKAAEAFKSGKSLELKVVTNQIKTDPLFVLKAVEELEKAGEIVVKNDTITLKKSPELVLITKALNLSFDEESLPEELRHLYQKLKNKAKDFFDLKLSSLC